MRNVFGTERWVKSLGYWTRPKIIQYQFARSEIESYILFMYAIQNGPNWWVDSVARFPVGQVQSRGRIGAMSDTMVRNPLDIDESPDSMTSVISDYEEEGQAGEIHEQDESHGSGIDNVLNDVESNNNSGASEEIVAAVAKHIEVIEQAMRQHQATGTSKFLDDDAESNKDISTESFNQSVADDMTQDPDAAFAATSPSQDRQGLFALLNAK